jgi:hypothetical protein
MLADILHFIEFVFVFALAFIALFITLLIVVSKMPNGNPLKMVLSALLHRLGATAGLMVIDPVATTLPVVGEVWDLATIAWLIYFWYTFFKQLPAMHAASHKAAHAASPQRPMARSFPGQPTQPLQIKRR